MSYHTKKVGKKIAIVRDQDGVVVGKSDTKAKALRSIGYREDANIRKAKQGNAKPIRYL